MRGGSGEGIAASGGGGWREAIDVADTGTGASIITRQY